jgi:hypothetical protein
MGILPKFAARRIPPRVMAWLPSSAKRGKRLFPGVFCRGSVVLFFGPVSFWGEIGERGRGR